MSNCKTSDVVLNLHEDLRNLDSVWLKRLLLTLPPEHLDGTVGDNFSLPVLIGDQTKGSVLLLKEIFAPYLTVISIIVTRKPAHLVTASDVSLEDAPYRLVFLGVDIKTWESSSYERVDLLSLEQKHSSIKSHDWMVTL